MFNAFIEYLIGGLMSLVLVAFVLKIVIEALPDEIYDLLFKRK